jgi:hypothetical protein
LGRFHFKWMGGGRGWNAQEKGQNILSQLIKSAPFSPHESFPELIISNFTRGVYTLFITARHDSGWRHMLVSLYIIF